MLKLATVLSFLLIESIFLVESPAAAPTDPSASPCPSGKFYNSLSHLCDQCPTACLTRPPPPDTSAYMLGRCRELASECRPPDPVVTTETPQPASHTPTDVTAPRDRQSAKDSPTMSSGSMAACIVVSVVALVLLAVALFFGVRRLLMRRPLLSDAVKAEEEGERQSLNPPPLPVAEQMGGQKSANGGGGQEACDTTPSSAGVANGNVTSAATIPEVEIKPNVV